jgi:hypothetical protein
MVTLYLRSQSSLGYEGVRLSVSWKIFATYLWQTTAALPLMYPIFGRTPFYQVGVLTGPFVISAATAALWVLSVGFILGVVRSFGYRVLELPTHRKLSWIGWVLFLSPGITIAITEKYQREIHRPGHAYLPVYLSYFGVALLLAMMMDFKLKAGREKGMAVVIGLILVLNFSLNHAGAEWLNQYWKYPRDQLEESIKQGFFDSARDGDWIVANQQPDWETNEFFDLVAKRKIRLGLLSNYFKLHEGPLPERLSYLHYLGDRHLRILALSPIAGENLKPMGTVRILIYDDRFPRRLVLKSPQFQVELETTGLWTTHLLSPTQFGLDWRDLRLSLM